MTLIRFVARPEYAHKPRLVAPSLGLLHATRGHTTLDLQDEATESWFTGGAPDQGGWAATADALVSADEDEIVVFENNLRDLLRFRSSYSAGYGDDWRNENAVDEHAISVEIAQSDRLEPFNEDTVARVVFFYRTLERELGVKFPYRRVSWFDQHTTIPVPTGFIGHEDTANGFKSGKTDPGSLWPWSRFFELMEGAADPQLRFLTPTQITAFGRELKNFSQYVNDSRVPDGRQAYLQSGAPAGKQRIVIDVPAGTLPGE